MAPDTERNDPLPTTPDTKINTIGTARNLTFGEKIVGLEFNPSGDDRVNKIKGLYAEIIDCCNDIEKKEDLSEFEKDLHKSAIMSAVVAQMSAIKLITWKE